MNLAGRLAIRALHAYARRAPTERGGYRLVRMARALIPRNEWSGRWNTPHNLQFDLNLGDYPDCCMAFGLYELDTERQIRRLLKPGDHFVDCGANIGYFTLIAAQLVGAGGRVDAFEPDPLNRQRLLTHLDLNGNPSQVRIHPVALGDQAGEATLHHPTGGGNHGMASLHASLAGPGQTYRVPVQRLDDVLAGTKPTLVKMDIEGAEMAAVRGLSGLLSALNPPRLILEHNPQAAAAAGHTPADLFRELQRLLPGCHIRWIGVRLWDIASAAKLDRQPRQGNILVEPA